MWKNGELGNADNINLSLGKECGYTLSLYMASVQGCSEERGTWWWGQLTTLFFFLGVHGISDY